MECKNTDCPFFGTLRDGMHYCNYLLTIGHSRGCDPTDCNVANRINEKKENDEVKKSQIRKALEERKRG